MHLTNNASLEDQWAARFTNLLGGGDPGLGRDYPVAVGEIQNPAEILTPREMAQADALTIEGGTSGVVLMERAGLAVAEAVRRHAPAGARVRVLTGPGNNGGDGFVAARILADAGYSVVVGALATRDELKGDAAFAAASWGGEVRGLSPVVAEEADIIVDAIFGAGLGRAVDGLTEETIEAVNRMTVPVIAVDLPSGVDGRTGRILGAAIEAVETVTFFRPKPGHFLLPGRLRCGRLTVVDIGIEGGVLEAIRPNTWHNTPVLWSLPPLAEDGHKYSRGHAVVVSGAMSYTGAARLAARAALRSGAGLVTVASPGDAIAVNAAHLTSVMLTEVNQPADLSVVLTDERKNAVVLGPGLGVGEGAAALVDAALKSAAAVVLDADALTSFAGNRERLFKGIKARRKPVVMTPHEGEFAKLFPDLLSNDSKVERARLAAGASGAVVILKGPDTVVAAPDGHAAISDNAPPQLATAGSGDVLAGMVGGLLAQGLGGYEAANAAVWLHGEAGLVRGRGLISEDLPEVLPAVFTELANRPR
jgi:hydroxyethylthiazole kinase-like uncharacterized protein yjeF